MEAGKIDESLLKKAKSYVIIGIILMIFGILGVIFGLYVLFISNSPQILKPLHAILTCFSIGISMSGFIIFSLARTLSSIIERAK